MKKYTASILFGDQAANPFPSALIAASIAASKFSGRYVNPSNSCGTFSSSISS